MSTQSNVVALPTGHGPVEEKWRTRDEIADHLSVSTRTITNYVQAGMPSLKLRGERRFKFSECERWLREQGWAA